MQVRFLLGPAGSGKTHRCLAEIRAALLHSPDGLPLVLLAPKQATFQLERQLLAEGGLAGYTRLRIFSFERLAEFIFDHLELPPPRLLSEEGRVMVLRALLTRKQAELKLFRAAARLPGFAQQLSLLLRELASAHIAPDRLANLAAQKGIAPQLKSKLEDLALLASAYRQWLAGEQLQDQSFLLDAAAEALLNFNRGKTDPKNERLPGDKTLLAGLWLDGFAEMTAQEIGLLAALVPLSEQATLAFCLDHEPVSDPHWLSSWSVVGHVFRECIQRIDGVARGGTCVEILPRLPEQGRFAASPALQHLERFWTEPKPWAPPVPQARATKRDVSISQPDDVRFFTCANPEAEVILAAREIRRHVRGGGRYREVAVITRRLEDYSDALRRVFTRYEIPFFLDRREPVAHHPLAELTRNALRTVGFGWRQADWFGALKSGLVDADDEAIDRLENEALANGWEGKAWHELLEGGEDRAVTERCEQLRFKLLPPFQELTRSVAQPCSGAQLAEALREFWKNQKVDKRLTKWSNDGKKETESKSGDASSRIHSTVWRQMLDWLDNLARAFAHDSLPLREWLPVLEAGLGALTVGVVPPALDQVLIGAIDRSRNPDLQFVLLLGVNEGVFPAPPPPPGLLTESDRAALADRRVNLGPNQRQRLGHERYLGYVACTRARRRLVLTCAARDGDGDTLNPSAYLAHLQRLFPRLELERFNATQVWTEAEHPCELVAPLLQNESQTAASRFPHLSSLAEMPVFKPVLERLCRFRADGLPDQLTPELADQIYRQAPGDPVLRTSVSRLEKFAECPFRFFVHSGLRAEERKRFELDAKAAGSFQHQVLEKFHDQLHAEAKRWHDISPAEARARIGLIVDQEQQQFQQGLLVSTDANQFGARSLGESLQSFIEVIVAWMAQYDFEPAAVELGFGRKGEAGREDDMLPAWQLDLGEGHRLAFAGKMDRVDLCVSADGREAFAVVIDYKSSVKKLDSRLMANGIQLQLPAYLAVLRRLPEAKALFQVSELTPAGVFFVNLRGRYDRGRNRDEVLGESAKTRKLAYRHSGRFDAEVLVHLDNRTVSRRVEKGDQFNFRLTASGAIHRGSTEALSRPEFHQLLGDVETLLKRMGRDIFAGVVRVDPYRYGSATPCVHCDYRSICRIDPWTHSYRALPEPDARPSEGDQ